MYLNGIRFEKCLDSITSHQLTTTVSLQITSTDIVVNSLCEFQTKTTLAFYFNDLIQKLDCIHTRAQKVCCKKVTVICNTFF